MRETPATENKTVDQAVSEPPPPRRFESRHELRIGERLITYRAIAGETYVDDAKGQPHASVFTTSYLVDEADARTDRPVTFVFNGGPGSSSMWLHMGGLGPRRVVVPGDATSAGAPPFPIVDNPHSPLDVTDLVFVDPVGTGFSRALGEYKAERFWGLDADASLLVDFVRTWLSEHQRWNAPRFLCGESYGTTRAVAMAEKMHGDLNGLGLNGLLLISVALDFHTLRFNRGNILPDIAFLPTYAATAHYHGMVRADDVETLTQEARDFARTHYATTLLAGDGGDGGVRERLAALTGLDAVFLERSRLRVEPVRFRKELLRQRGLTVGRFDGRYVGRDHDAAGEAPEDDAAAYAIDAAYFAAINDHLRRTLGVDMDRTYVGFTREANRRWDWLGQGDPDDRTKPRVWPSNINVTPALARIVREQPRFQLLVANGLYDVATPFFAAELSLSLNGIEPERARLTYYDAGHMMYVHPPSLAALGTDLRATIRAGIDAPPPMAA